MTRWLQMAGRCYTVATERLTPGQDIFLLLIRLYWGWQLVGAGWGKLTNVSAAARFFEEIGIFWPKFNAVVSGCGELFGGLLLIVGLATRLAALMLVFNMAVAFLTAHMGDARAIIGEPSRFITSPPFTFLMASLIVVLFGPGFLALDTLVRQFLIHRKLVVVPTPSLAETTEFPAGKPRFSRREVAQLGLAAVGGLVLGAWMRGLATKTDSTLASGGAGGPKGGSDPGSGGFTVTADARKTLDAEDAAAAEGLKPSLLLEEPHVCCGLNTCKGKAKGGANSCVGQGTCATAKGHVCQGQNDCKGQGGCGEFPGQNTCDSKGACAVPLKKETWPKARKRFEELLKKIGTEPGTPGADCPKT